jgi:hypothetical protein
VRPARTGTFWVKTALVAAAVVGAAGAVAAGQGPLRRYFSPDGPRAEEEIAPPPASPSNVALLPSPQSIEPPASPIPSSSAAPQGAAHGQIRPDTLAHETMMLEEARRRMAAEPLRALRMLNLHQRRYPKGELTAERMFLRVDALARLGRTDEAYAVLDALKRRFPDSAYARLAPSLITAAPPAAKP